MIRILHFSAIINHSDFIDTVLSRLDPSRFEVSALTGATPTRLRSGAAAYPNEVLGFPFTRRNYPRMLRALLSSIRRFQPHILHAHHYDECLVASVARRLRVVPCYAIGHHYSDHIYLLTQGLKRRVFLAGERFAQEVASCIVVPTADVRRILVERQKPPPCKVEVVPYGVEVGSLRPTSPQAPLRIRQELGLEGKYVAMTCCRLNPEKGLHYLLQAVSQVSRRRPDFRLVLVGSGPCEPRLREWCRRLAIEHVVHFAGWRNEALDWLASADVVVQPSLSESFCQTLVEALALSKPVIMTPVGAAPDVLGENERGLLVPVGDADALASAIERIAEDRALGERLGAAGRDYVGRYLGADRMARKYEEIYLESWKQSSSEEREKWTRSSSDP
jgi:glycosyltransferase involved in cell wall biosynthesis